MSQKPRLQRSAVAGVVLSVMAIGACATGGQLPSTIPEFMYEHFGQVGRVQTAVIIGDLAAAKQAAQELAESSTHPDIPEEGREALVRMRWHAGQVADATTLGTAAKETANMAATCGECHAEVAGGPQLSMEESPPPGETTGRHMMRHLWAADRLWEGLIGPSDDLWEAGATALDEEPMHLVEGASTRQERLASLVHDLGTQALTRRTQEDRADLYGRLLETCSGCHTAGN